MPRTPLVLVSALVVMIGSAGCVPGLPAQHPPGHPPAPPAAQHPPAPRPIVAADIHFVQGMIGHHQQAVVMSALAETHAANDRVRLLARKIDLSQRDEIAFMNRWLADRAQPLPDSAAHGHHHMPGMLTAEQMQRLAAARGAAFDRLFLELMIQHHEGAITMVKALFDAPGGGQDQELFQFASDVDADQRGEIHRMQQLLMSLPARSPSR